MKVKDHVILLGKHVTYPKEFIVNDIKLQVGDNVELLQPFTEIIETNAKSGLVPLATSNVKLFLETIWSDWR